MRIDVHGARLIAKVDQHQEEAYLKGLNHDTNYGISSNLTSVVLVGGKYQIKVTLTVQKILNKVTFHRSKFRRKASRSQIHH